MKKTNIVYVLLVIIIILSLILIKKIDKTPKYNLESYNKIYNEYEDPIIRPVSRNRTNSRDSDIVNHKHN